MPNFIDLSEQRFGRLLVINRAPDHFTKSGTRITMWNCVCDCGNKKVITANALRKGATISCGCYGGEQKSKRLAERNRRNAKHGYSRERLHAIWSGMINRCYNPNNTCFSMYGERGISVCKAWRDDYIVFREWALENGYNQYARYGDCTLDRIDNSKGYSPSNCRWATAEQQANNKRNKIIVSAFGKAQNLKAWAEETGIKYGTLYDRIVVRKWDAERALREPAKGVVCL